MEEKLAFICFYGQIRVPEKALESLKELRERLESEGYTVKVIAHLWYDYDERSYDHRRPINEQSNKEKLDFFISEFKPCKMKIENSMTFNLKYKDKMNHNDYDCIKTLSQMNSRQKLSNLLYEYCIEKDLSEALLKSFPVFTTRLDFGRIINNNILNEFKENSSKIIIANKYQYNDNFIVMNTFNFLAFFDNLDKHIKEYLENDSTIPKNVHNWWGPERILMERTIDLNLEIVYSDNIPNFM